MAYTLPIVACLVIGAAEGLVRVGEFRNYVHGIGGEVFAKNESTLVVEEFTYDGQGPDAFFWAGTTGKPSRVGTILPHPFKGNFYEYEDRNAPILEGRFTGDKIMLTLPPGLKASEIKWLSVWCRAFAVNFGDVYFPENLVVEQEEVVPKTELPPPVIEPDNNLHDHHGDEEDSDVKIAAAESEPESESESEPYSVAANSLASCGHIFASVVVSLAAAFSL